MNLNNMHRDGIRRRALEGSFAVREEALTKEEEALADKIYASWTTEEQRTTFETLHAKWPEIFNNWTTRIRVNVGQTHELDMSRAWPRLASWQALSATKFQDQVLTLVGKKEDLTKERARAEKALFEMLKGVKSISQLRKVWPEGEPFYSHIKDKDSVTLPAIVVADVNRLFNLPKVPPEPVLQPLA